MATSPNTNMLIRQEIEHIATDGRDKTEQRMLKAIADLRALGATQETIDCILAYTIVDSIEQASEAHKNCERMLFNIQQSQLAKVD